ncbi:MAG: hypothetical protein ABIN99_13890 [Nitrosospira sp.]
MATPLDEGTAKIILARLPVQHHADDTARRNDALKRNRADVKWPGQVAQVGQSRKVVKAA